MSLGILDIVIVILSVVICIGIGFWSRQKQKSNVENFLLGDRKISFIPAAISILATMVSANGMTTSSVEVFNQGAQYLILPIGFLLMQGIQAFLVVPILHNMDYISFYEYLEHRFDKTMRIIYSLGFLTLNILLTAVYLFVPAISITTVTGLSIYYSIIASGLVCTLYCVIGGLKAVIWTDVVQVVLMFSGLGVILIRGFLQMGHTVWEKAFHGRLHEHFRFFEDGSTGRHNVFALILFGISLSFFFSFGNQAGAQRILCVKSKREAIKSVLFSLVLMVLMQGLVGIVAIVIFAKLTSCNPFARPEEKIFVPDQIYMYGAEKLINNLPGCKGIVLAGLLSAALSTVSSNINSFAAITLEDYLKWIVPRHTTNDARNVLYCKILTGFYGILVVVLCMIIPQIGGVLKAMILVLAGIGGPLTGVLFLAFFMKRAHKTACKIAILISLTTSIWLAYCSFIYFKPKIFHLVHTTDGCQFDEDFGTNITITQRMVNSSYIPQHTHNVNDIFILYRISTLWYSPISTTLSALLGFLLSYIFKKPASPDPRLVSHIILNDIEKEELNRLLEEKEHLKEKIHKEKELRNEV